MKILGWMLAIFVAISIFGAINKPASTNSARAGSTIPAHIASEPSISYLERLTPSIQAAKELNPRDFTKDTRTIAMAFALFDGWGELASNTPVNMTAEETKARNEFIVTLSTKQKQALPILRDAYGPAMRQVLWEANAKARTIGGGYRTVEFIAGEFAANRNIKSTHEDMYATLMQMRFTRAQYKWLDANVEYTYYTLKPPADGDVGFWRNGAFRKAE